LQAANDSREHAQDSGFRSCGDSSFGWWFREETTIARTPEVRCENRGLSFELEDGPVDERLLLKKGRVVGAESSGEIIGAVQDEVIIGQEIEAVSGIETSRVFDDRDVRVDFGEAVPGAGEFRGAVSIRIVKDLAVEIGEVDLVGINETNRADPGGGEVEERRGAEAAGADT